MKFATQNSAGHTAMTIIIRAVSIATPQASSCSSTALPAFYFQSFKTTTTTSCCSNPVPTLDSNPAAAIQLELPLADSFPWPIVGLRHPHPIRAAVFVPPKPVAARSNPWPPFANRFVWPRVTWLLLLFPLAGRHGIDSEQTFALVKWLQPIFVCFLRVLLLLAP